MPRKGAGPRLWFDKARGTWTILDGKRRERTGCSEHQTVEAQQALKEYLGEKHEVAVTDDPCLADILTVYLDEHVPTLPVPVHGDGTSLWRSSRNAGSPARSSSALHHVRGSALSGFDEFSGGMWNSS